MKSSPRCLCALLVASGAVAACGESAAPAVHRIVPADIRAVAGADQSGIVGQELPLPVVVEVTDDRGAPVPDQIINFRVLSGGGSVFAGVAQTNSAGRAQERWTLGTRTSEAQRLEARAVDAATGAPLVFATLTATPLADTPAALKVVAGDLQTGAAGAALGTPLAVRVEDRYGNPDPAVVVSWVVEDGGGSLEAQTSVTDPTGLGTNSWTPGRTAPSQHVRADLGGLSVRFTTAAVGGFPASLRKVRGDRQHQMPGTPVAVPPTVLVTDALGAPVADVDVQFVVTAGGGELVGPIARTDAAGTASCGAWTLGGAAGENDLIASVQGLGAVVFSATGAFPTRVDRAAGDSQWAPPGTAVATAPVVLVTAGGVALAGVPVQFTITSGGGAVGTGSAVTDAAGRASCGSWTLGPSKQVNRMAASVPGLAGVGFVAYAGLQSPTITVQYAGVSDPCGPRIGSATFVAYAGVVSVYPIVSVTASIGSADVPFSISHVNRCSDYPNYSVDAWNGAISTTGLFGPATVVITATDSHGNQVDAFLEVVIDRRPTVTLAAPPELALARPTLEARATCLDDHPAGCATLALTGNGVTLAQGTSEIEGTLDLSAFERDGVVKLCASGTDLAGQAASVCRTVYVYPSPKVGVVASAPGHVVDASGSRVLFFEPGSGAATLRILDAGTGVTQTLRTETAQCSPPENCWFSLLTPAGAIYAPYRGPGFYVAYEWRDGHEDEIGPVTFPPMLEVAGGYALFAHTQRGLVRRTLSSGEDVVIAPGAPEADLASDGDVVYLGSVYGEVLRYREGVTTKISSEPPGVTASNWDPRTDGTTIMYARQGASGDLLVVNDGATEVLLSGSSGLWLGGQLLAGGWVVYGRYQGVPLLDELCRYGPGGVEVLASGLDPSGYSTPEAMSPDGTLVFTQGGRRLRAIPGHPPEDIGSSLGRTVFREGTFLVLIGGSVLQILP